MAGYGRGIMKLGIRPRREQNSPAPGGVFNNVNNNNFDSQPKWNSGAHTDFSVESSQFSPRTQPPPLSLGNGNAKWPKTPPSTTRPSQASASPEFGSKRRSLTGSVPTSPAEPFTSPPVFERTPSMDEDDPENCKYCNRPSCTIICRSCGHTFHGRVNTKCPLHPGILHLMDVTACPECLSPQLKETAPVKSKAPQASAQPSIELWD